MHAELCPSPTPTPLPAHFNAPALAVGLLTCLTAHAADTTRTVHLAAFVMDESIALPGGAAFAYPFEPAFGAELSYPLKETRHGTWTLTGGLGYYRHRYVRSAVHADASFGYRWTPGRFSAAGMVGLGYAHAFVYERVFAFEDSDYREVRNAGTGVFSPSLALTLGYRLGDGARPISVLARARSSFESPFALLPLPHFFFGFGVSRPLFSL